MFDNQYVFRTEHSTEPAALELTDRMPQMDTDEIFTWTFSKHSTHWIIRFSRKTEPYGVKEVALGLIRKYLTIRKQYVTIEDAKSEMLNISTSVRFDSMRNIVYHIH